MTKTQETLASEINLFWERRGYYVNAHVATIIEEIEGHEPIKYKAVRSDLVDGLPPRFLVEDMREFLPKRVERRAA